MTQNMKDAGKIALLLLGAYALSVEGQTQIRGSQIMAGTVTSTQLSATGVSAGSYGNGTNVGSFTVDAAGRITAASNTAITGGSGTVTTTGSPANGNLAKFTGATSISNVDLSGDVTTTGGSLTTIPTDTVTYAKMQNVSAASKLLGRGDGGSGDPQEITLGTGLSMSGTTLSSSGGSGALTLLESHTASSSANLNFTTAFTSTYDVYLITFTNIIPATDAVNFLLRMSTDGGSNYDTGSNYRWTVNFGSTASADGAAGSASDTSIFIAGTISNTTASGGTSGSFKFYNPLSTSVHKTTAGELNIAHSDTNRYVFSIAGWYASTTAVNAVRFLMSSGNIASGTIRVYGISQ